MTDTTEQQAVTVAQDDWNLAADIIEAIASKLSYAEPWLLSAETWRRGHRGYLEHVFIPEIVARHRLASVSSANAETLQAQIAQDQASFGALPQCEQDNLQREISLIGASNPGISFAASPGPVPATNQAGEVEKIARLLCEQHGGAPDAEASEATDCWEGPLWSVFVEDAKAVLAALATQPATSQEGDSNEARRVLTRITVAHNRLRRSEITAQEFDTYGLGLLAALAATPTPPTLSEDLRGVDLGPPDELGSAAFELLALGYAKATAWHKYGIAWDHLERISQEELIEAARAALNARGGA